MDIKTIRIEFKKKVMMGCHPGKTLEEAREEERSKQWCGFSWYEYPITIARVMQACNIINSFILVNEEGNFYEEEDSKYNQLVARHCIGYDEEEDKNSKWQFTKDGRECVDDDQSDECITSLLTLLKSND